MSVDSSVPINSQNHDDAQGTGGSHTVAHRSLKRLPLNVSERLVGVALLQKFHIFFGKIVLRTHGRKAPNF